MAKEKSLKKNFILNFIRVLMTLLFPLITFPYASRILLPSGIGKVNFATSIISYFLLISSLGINTYGIRECAKFRNDKKRLSIIVKELLMINLIFTVLAYILLGVSLAIIPKFALYRNLLLISSMQIISTTIGIDWLYSALEEYEYITIRSILFQTLSLVLLFLLVKNVDDYLVYAGITVFSATGSNLLNFIHSRKYIDWKIKANYNLLKHMKPILVIFTLNLSVNIYTNLNSVMLGFMKGDEAVGIYTAAIKIIKIVGLLITSLGVVLLPRLSYYLNEKRGEEFDNLIKKSLNFVLLISVPAVVGLGILSPQIINIFSGDSFSGAVVPMRIMCLIILFTSISNLTGMQILVPTNNERKLVVAVSISAIVNLILNFYLIPRYGILGASVSMLIAEFIATATQIVFLWNYVTEKGLFKYFYQYCIAAIIMGIVVLLVLKSIDGLFAQITVSIIIGSLSYGGICLLFKNPTALELLSQLKRMIIKK